MKAETKKTPVLQMQLDAQKTARLDKNMEKAGVNTRIAFAERALDFVMPLIESGQMVNLNGKLVLADDAAKQLKVA